MGYEPENTLLSFQKALECGVDMVELDARSCKTGQVMVIHDHKLERTTNGHGYVNKRPFEYIRSLDAGKGEKVPTLPEVLDLLAAKVDVNIEVKGKRTLKDALHVCERYVQEKGWRSEQFIFSTFFRSKLKKIAKYRSHFRVGALWGSFSYKFMSFAVKIKADTLHVHKEILNQEIIEQAHSRGLKVFVWTVNEKNDIKRFTKMGVDGIFSDYPDRI